MSITIKFLHTLLSTVISLLMEFNEVKQVNAEAPVLYTSHFGNNGNSHNASNRHRGSMVGNSVQLSVIRSKYYWKVVVEQCTCYLG